MPVKFGYSVGHKLKGFAKISLYPSILLNVETTTPKVDTDENLTEYEILNIKDKVTKFELERLSKLGVNYGV